MMQDKKNKVKNIFDSIAFRYDFLNHLLSFGVDKYWRRKALKLSKVGSESFLLDVACGTGDVAIEAYKQGVRKIIGADFSQNMLQLFSKKSDWIKGKTVQTTAEQMPFTDNTFTNIKFYFKRILPFIGGIISKNKTAYQYLPNSVEEFDEKIYLVDMLKQAGFKSVKKFRLTFGIVQVVIAEK
ncbi:MAG: methyltransferase domain-containing protein [Ignavibacteria bacterium CHB3]|nr:methyltransferase domain-containing protein [Ignavibacteria bacterium CHB3]